MEYTKRQLALIEKHREHATDYNWWDSTYEDFIAVAKAFGIDTDKERISFSGFWSQGDGASFETDTFSLADILDAGLATLQNEDSDYGKDPEQWESYLREFYKLYQLVFDKIGHHALLHPEGREVAEGYKWRVYSNSHYSHANTMCLNDESYNSWDIGDSDNDNGALTACVGLDLNEFHDELRDQLRACANELYASLESEYDYLTSDEQVWERITANGWDKYDEEDEDESAEAA